MNLPLKNLAASVRQRLADLAAKKQYDFQQVLTTFAIERLLYRLGASKHANKFILKGATLFALWEGFPHRQTRDLDLLGFGETGIDELVKTFSEVAKQSVEPDGISFEVSGADEIRTAQEYGGVRLNLIAKIERAEIPFGVDVGFGDQVTPPPRETEFPTLLNFPKPKLRVYPVETVVAEKLEAMVRLGMANTRMKDFFDLWHLSRTVQFDGEKLVAAIKGTFTRRATNIPSGLPIALTDEFYENPSKQTQWKAFSQRDVRHTKANSLPEVIQGIVAFVKQPLSSAEQGIKFLANWNPETGWVITTQR